MEQKDIKVGETYLFVATLSKHRKHLEGQPFTVTEKSKVWRAQTLSRRHKVWRIFNVDGVGARPDELEPLDPNTCHICGKSADFTCDKCEQPTCEEHLVPHTLQRPMEECRCKRCDTDDLPF